MKTKSCTMNQTPYQPHLKSLYTQIPKTPQAIGAFVQEHRPLYIKPYTDLWNLFAERYHYPTVRTITRKRKQKLKTRLNEQHFDFVAILRAAAASRRMHWLSFDWIMENESNYVKILEGNYTQLLPEPKPIKDTVLVRHPVTGATLLWSKTKWQREGESKGFYLIQENA